MSEDRMKIHYRKPRKGKVGSMEDNSRTPPREGLLMTPEQITNWRKVMVRVMGPYALIMPDEDIIALRDNLQRKIGHESGKEEAASVFLVEYHLTSSIGLTKTDRIEVRAEDKKRAKRSAAATLRREYPNSIVCVISIEKVEAEEPLQADNPSEDIQGRYTVSDEFFQNGKVIFDILEKLR